MKKIILCSFLSLVAVEFSAQSSMSVPYQSLLDVNPSFAGSNGYLRNQTSGSAVPNTNGEYYTLINSFDGYSSSLKTGAALSAAFSNYNNFFKTSSASVAFAKYFKIGEKLKIIPSLQLAYVVKQINVGYFSSSMYTTAGNYPWARAEYFSLGTGLLVNYSNFYVGASLIDFNRPDVGVFGSQKIYPTFKIHASYNMHVSDNLLLHFYGHAVSQTVVSSQLLSVNALIFKHFIYGVSCQPRDVFAMNAGFKTNYFTAQASLNRSISALTPENKNFYYWQMMLAFNLRNAEQRNAITNFEAW